MGNIAYDATEADLNALFSEVGPVVSFRLVWDEIANKSKGYGFCEYADAACAMSAMRNLNGREFHGRPLRVDFAEDRKGDATAPGSGDKRARESEGMTTEELVMFEHLARDLESQPPPAKKARLDDTAPSEAPRRIWDQFLAIECNGDIGLHTWDPMSCKDEAVREAVDLALKSRDPHVLAALKAGKVDDEGADGFTVDDLPEELRKVPVAEWGTLAQNDMLFYGYTVRVFDL